MARVANEAQKVINAFYARRPARAGRSQQYGGSRYETDGTKFWLWGNEIASWQNGKIRACDARYQSLLTKNTLNAIFDDGGLRCSIYQQRNEWKLMCAPEGYGTEKRKVVKWPGCVTFRPRS